MPKREFTYRQRDFEDVNKRATQNTGSYDTIFKEQLPIFTSQQGTNCIRFLPPSWKEARHYGYDVWVHNDIGADHSAYLCPKEMNGEDCPICEERDRMSADGASIEELRRFKPSKRVVAWIIDRDKEKEGPLIFNMSVSQDKDISALCVDKRKGTYLLIDDPEKGYDVEFNREGTGLKTRYRGYVVARDPSPISDNERQMDKWLDFIMDKPIPDLLEFKTYEYIAKVFAGQKDAVSKRDEDEEEERPARRRSLRDEIEEEEEEEPKPRRSSRKVVEEEEEEEEEEKPVKKPTKTKTKVEEEVEDEEDEDEEKPVKKTKGKVKDEDEDEEDNDGDEEEDSEEDSEEEDVSSSVRKRLNRLGKRD